MFIFFYVQKFTDGESQNKQVLISPAGVYIEVLRSRYTLGIYFFPLSKTWMW